MPRALPWPAQALGLWLVASLLPGVAVGQATLYWGQNGAGGSGTASAAGAWWTGTSQTTWSSSGIPGTVNLVFGGTAGTVVLGNNRSALDVKFETSNYTLAFGNSLGVSSFSGSGLASTTFVGSTTGTASVTISANADATFAGTIADGGGVTNFSKAGTGRLAISAYTATGRATITDGILRLNSASNVPPSFRFNNTGTGAIGILELAAGNYSLNFGSTTTGGLEMATPNNNSGFSAIGGGRTVTMNNGTNDVVWWSGNSGGGSGNRLQAAELILSGSDSTGTLMLTHANAATGFGLRLQSSSTSNSPGTYTRTIRTENGTAAIDAEIAMPLKNSTLADRIGAITKVGNGVLALSAANNYTGATTVSAGGLLINGTTAAASTVTVSSGAFLGGTGFVGGAVTVDGAIAPGSDGIGTLTTGSDVTWNAGNSWFFSLGTPAASLAAAAAAGTNNDYLNVGGAFNGSGGSYTFDFANSGSDGWYKLVGYSTTNFSTGTNTQFAASNVPSGKTATFVVDSGSNAVYVQIVPEPSTIFLAGMGVVFAGLVARQRRRRA